MYRGSKAVFTSLTRVQIEKHSTVTLIRISGKLKITINPMHYQGLKRKSIQTNSNVRLPFSLRRSIQMTSNRLYRCKNLSCRESRLIWPSNSNQSQLKNLQPYMAHQLFSMSVPTCILISCVLINKRCLVTQWRMCIFAQKINRNKKKRNKHRFKSKIISIFSFSFRH